MAVALVVASGTKRMVSSSVGDPVGFGPDPVQNRIRIHLFLLSNKLIPFT
jgi:hypothetical protein